MDYAAKGYSVDYAGEDKIDGRRGKAHGLTGRVVDDYGFPDQPMLDEMTAKALAVLHSSRQGSEGR